MKGDFSRNTFHPENHYRAVLKQQGRVEVDADWNEQQAINFRRIETEAADVIGRCGAPLHDAGFEIAVDAKGTLRIGAGRYYVEGILCENETDGLDYLAQPDCPHQPSIIDALEQAKTSLGLVYLDVWPRHLTALDAPFMREKALGGPDTCSRAKTLWQVKVLPVSLPAPTGKATAPRCETDFAEWGKLVAASTSRLNARTQPADSDEGPCLLPPSAGYQRLENQLYRVEIHRGTADGPPTFVWSRDNGSVLTAIETLGGNNVVVSDIGRDDVLGLANGQWVEITDDELELNGQRGQLHQIGNVAEATRTITLTTVPQAAGAHAKMRRWDQTGGVALQDGVPMTFGWQPLEGGVEVKFSRDDAAGNLLTYKTGDYWLIPARTATGEIEWPPYEVPNTNPRAQPPAGIRHHYCRLALAQLDGRKIKLQDCRHIFPPLTELKTEECCAVTMSPNQDWKTALANLKSASASICFQVGDYTTDEPIQLKDFKSLKITGGGPGTRILAPKSEAAFIFTNCESVEVTDLYGETGSTGFDSAERKHLRGVLTFFGCGSVTIDSVALKGADWMNSPGATRAASCICVEPGEAAKQINTASVRIRHCDLTVGYFQVGVLIVDAERAQIEDNRIAVNMTHLKFNLIRLLQNRQIRTNVRKFLVADPVVQPAPKAVATAPPIINRRISPASSAATFTTGTAALHFNTAPLLKKILPVLLAAEPIKPGVTAPLPIRLSRLADKVLLDAKFRRATPALGTWFKELVSEIGAAPTPCSQGIVVAGRMATEVRIRDNTIVGASQGIHVGLSHKSAQRPPANNAAVGVRRADTDVAVSVSITGNSVHVYASVLLRAREGIFVGNCDNLVIESNRLLVTPPVSKRSGNFFLKTDGIRVFGWLSSLVIIRQNRLTDFLEPITITPLGEAPKLQLPLNSQLGLENLFD